MSDIQLSGMVQAAKDAGVSRENLPDGVNTFLVKSWSLNDKKAAEGKYGWGLQVKIVGGPDDGTVGWMNQTIGEGNPVGTDIWLGILEKLGVSREVSASSTVGAVSESLVGLYFEAEKYQRPDKKNPDRSYQDFRNIKLVGAPGATAPQVAPQVPAQAPVPAAVPPAAPQQAPVPAAPAPAPAAVPAPAPAAAPAPVPVDQTTGAPTPY